MPTSDMVKIAIVQFNPIVGAIEENCDRMIELYRRAADEGAELVIFPEMAMTGYPIEDLALSRTFVQATVDANVRLIQSLERDAGILFGTLFPRCNDADRGGEDTIAGNAAFLFDPLLGRETHVAVKHELPNYGVFDEKRIFCSSSLDSIEPLPFRGHKLGIMICEDCWFPRVSKQLRDKGAEVLIALNGSPFEVSKHHVRVGVAKARVAESTIVSNVSARGCEELQLPFVYVNMVGGQDELVFDGGSFILSHLGLSQMPFFKEDVIQCTLSYGYQLKPISMSEPSQDSVLQIYRACVLGLRDYMRKQGFRSAVLGMSGGVDSGIVAAIAADAIGPKNVHLVRLPSKFSSDGSLDDAARAALRLGSPIRTIPIEPVVESLREVYRNAQPATPIVNEQRGVWQEGLSGVADENIQARARGNILMAISNQEGHLLLTTGNKSEVSVGYCTLYGDMSGGFNPIKDCYKTTVWAMCRMRNSLAVHDLEQEGFLGNEAIVVPEEIIVKPPSAELRPDQQDSDSLPPYETLDAILKNMIEDQMGIREIVDQGHDAVLVSRIRFLLDRAEYKRRQAAPGVKITSKLHSRERRVPIINHFVEKPPRKTHT